MTKLKKPNFFDASDLKYEIRPTKQFIKDYKKALLRGKKEKKILDVIFTLAKGEQLPLKFREHKLAGEYSDYFECHIEPDWLLVYYLEENHLVLVLARTGSHSDLFGK